MLDMYSIEWRQQSEMIYHFTLVHFDWWPRCGTNRYGGQCMDHKWVVPPESLCATMFSGGIKVIYGVKVIYFGGEIFLRNLAFQASYYMLQ